MKEKERERERCTVRDGGSKKGKAVMSNTMPII